jgi:outer membrane protein assembly factor BamB
VRREPATDHLPSRVVWSPTSGDSEAPGPAIAIRGAAEDAVWEAELTVLNATAGVLWIDAVTLGPALSVFPSHAGIRAGTTENLKLTITRGRLTEANAAAHRLQVTWNVIPPPGQTPTGPTRGLARLPVQVAPPRPATRCPDPRCGARVPAEADRCPTCRAWLMACPVCGATNSRLSAVCSADSRHRLRPTGPWACVGGGPEHLGVQRQRAGQALRLRWQSPLPGRPAVSWSAPVCAYGAVFVAGHRESGESFVVALDGQSGEAIWRYDLPAGDPVYPDRGAVAVAGGAVYAATVGGRLVALDAERGTLRWSQTLAGRVYSAVVAASAQVVTVETGDVSGRVAAWHAPDGQLVRAWELAGGADSAVAMVDGLILAHAEDGRLLALDPAADTPRWSAETGGRCDASPVVAEGRVFSASETGEVRAVELADGSPAAAPFTVGARIGATPGYWDGRLWFGADDGALYSLNRDLRLVSRMGVGAQLRAGVVLLEDAVVFGADDGILRVSDGEREVRFQYETGAGACTTAGLSAALGAVFFASTAGTLYAMESVE